MSIYHKLLDGNVCMLKYSDSCNQSSLVLLHHVICHDVNVSFMESCMEMIINTGPAGQSCKLPVQLPMQESADAASFDDIMPMSPLPFMLLWLHQTCTLCPRRSHQIFLRLPGVQKHRQNSEYFAYSNSITFP